MLIKKGVLLCLYFCSIFIARAELPYFDYHKELKEAYHLSIQLRSIEAAKVLNALSIKEPQNLAVLHIENYIDFFDAFITEEGPKMRSFSNNLEKRLSIIEGSEVPSPYWRFARAEMLLQHALARAKFGEELKAGWDINKAYKLLIENERLYPDFKYNKKSLSIIHSLIGSLKGFQKSLVLIFTSLDGSYDQGVKEIDDLFDSVNTGQNQFFGEEVFVIQALIAHHIEKDASKAVRVISDPYLDDVESPLIDFVRASLYLQSSMYNQAILTLETGVNRPKQTAFFYLNLMLGNCLLNQLNPVASRHISEFLSGYRGRNYIKEGYQKQAWVAWLINRDQDAYHKSMNLALINGHDEIGEDQDAYREAKIGKIPHYKLLKARVLCDGGGFSKALEVMRETDYQQLPQELQTEYFYRLGRIYQGLGEKDKAIEAFNTTISEGRKSDSYFACNAALQMGIIYFKEKQSEMAKNAFQDCLRIKPQEHRKSLHQKARSWLLKMQLNE